MYKEMVTFLARSFTSCLPLAWIASAMVRPIPPEPPATPIIAMAKTVCVCVDLISLDEEVRENMLRTNVDTCIYTPSKPPYSSSTAIPYCWPLFAILTESMIKRRPHLVEGGRQVLTCPLDSYQDGTFPSV